MTISTRTPEGQPFRCPVCNEDTDLEPSPAGDACCPACGHLLGWFRERVDKRVSLESSLDDLDSIEFVELVMQLEEEYGVNVSEAEADEIRTIADAIRALRKRKYRGEN